MFTIQFGSDRGCRGVVEPQVRAAQSVRDVIAYEPSHHSLADLLEAQAKRLAVQPYLITYDSEGGRHAYSYAVFIERVRCAAGYLAARGVRRGDRVGTILQNHQEAVFIMMATWWLGAALVPINTEETPQRKRFILTDAGVSLLFTLPEYRPEVESEEGLAVISVGEAMDFGAAPAPPRGALGDGALIVYTSGTTGNPKGVLLSQFNLLADASAITRWFGITPGERWLCVLPIHHVNGIVVTLLSPLYAGAAVVLNSRFSARTFWPRASAEGVSVASLVPTLLEFLLETGGAPPPGMRGVICGAGPLAPQTALRFEERFGIPVWHGYGLSESTAYACMTPLDLTPEVRRTWYGEHGFPTIGTAMAYQALSIRDAAGEPLAAGRRGEICLSGSTIMLGYLRRPDANASAFSHHGWFRSGDEGFWLPGPGDRPFYFITGRLKELIIRGGVNLSPLEIDPVLIAHPAVRFGMAVPFANRWYGEEVAAYVVLAEGVEPTEQVAQAIKDHCGARLSFPMQPKLVLFGEDLPYTSTGKPKRLALKELLADRLTPYFDVQFREGAPT